MSETIDYEKEVKRCCNDAECIKFTDWDTMPSYYVKFDGLNTRGFATPNEAWKAAFNYLKNENRL